MLFLGNYEYAPNVDAVEWMLDEILPRVWAHCPEARMSVCGYALPAEWAQRWSDPRIEWQGFVPDLLQLQSSSSVFLAALRHGGGSKLKVLEALAAGLPLASTAQGLGQEQGDEEGVAALAGAPGGHQQPFAGEAQAQAEQGGQGQPEGGAEHLRPRPRARAVA